MNIELKQWCSVTSSMLSTPIYGVERMVYSDIGGRRVNIGDEDQKERLHS